MGLSPLISIPKYNSAIVYYTEKAILKKVKVFSLVNWLRGKDSKKIDHFQVDQHKASVLGSLKSQL